MEIIVITGARCLPTAGSFAMSGPSWPAPAGMPISGGNRNAVAVAARPVYRDRLQTLITLDGTHFPVIDRMRLSASEP